MRRVLRLLCTVALLPSTLVVCGQSIPALRPPAQTYIYDFVPAAHAIVPAVPFLNLGPSFSIEFWIMLDRDGTHTLAISVGGIWTQGYVTVSIR